MRSVGGKFIDFSLGLYTMCSCAVGKRYLLPETVLHESWAAAGGVVLRTPDWEKIK